MKVKTKRNDIQSLRGLAVLLVLLFHLKISWMPAGFIGVDIFLVISGFLITKIFLENNRHTGIKKLSWFYLSRIKRLYPAIIVTVLLTIISSHLVFTTSLEQGTFNSSVWSLLGAANIFFYSKSGYFDLDSYFKPLLHIWSLALEIQFYLFFAIIMVVLREKGKHIFLCTLLLALPSLYYCDIAASSGAATAQIEETSRDLLNKDAAYFLLPFRFFEFAIGILSFFIWSTLQEKKITLNKTFKNIALYISFLTIIISAMVLKPSMPVPGYLILPSLVACAFILIASIPVSKPLLPLVWIGNISYSLYLAHWPVIVFINYLLPQSFLRLILCVALSVAIGFIMNKYVEEMRFPHQKFNSKLIHNSIYTILFTVILIVAVTLDIDKLKPPIVTENTLLESLGMRYRHIPFSCNINDLKGKNCDPLSRKILVIGDSHEPDGINIFQELLKESKKHEVVAFGLLQGCAFSYKDNIVFSKDDKKLCIDRAVQLNAALESGAIGTVVLSLYRPLDWGISYINLIEKLSLNYSNINFIILTGYIGIRPENCSELINRYGSHDTCFEEKYVSYFAKDEGKILGDKFNTIPNVFILDKVKLLCSSKRVESCLTTVDNVPAFYDSDHLTLEFSKHIATLAKEHYEFLKFQ